MTTEEEPSVYDSDASQASGSRRRRRRTAAPRKSTSYLLAVPPRISGTKKTLFKTIRPRLVLQLQELVANQRSRPTIDVFPSTLLAGAYALPRMFGAKRELCSRDLILVKSEDYTASTGEADETRSSRRQPVAVLSSGRGQADGGEILLDDGSVWACSSSSSKAHYNFIHVDDHGTSLTVRWVKRNPSRRVSGAPLSPVSSQVQSPYVSGKTVEAADPDYRYTFSIIDPTTRRHPILANLTPQSIEIYDEYTAPSPSSTRHPPTRPVSDLSGATNSNSVNPPPASLSISGSSQFSERHTVDENIQKLIMVTGLWLALRVGPSLDSPDTAGDAVSGSQDTPRITTSSTYQSTFPTLPRRQTTSCGSSTPPIPIQATRIRRAMSTGAAFMQRRRRTDSSQTLSSTGTIVELGTMAAPTEVGSDQALKTPVVIDPVSKRARRISWFKKLKH
ncbi:unnamed protein product [Discula destructiva]